MNVPAVLTTDLGLPEGPRWHNGTLYVSDITAGSVVAVDGAGNRRVVAAVAAQPSGLGWLPDGRMLVVSMLDRRLNILEPDGAIRELVDLTGLAVDRCNDMVVDDGGLAYVGDYPVSPGATPQERLENAVGSNLILVDTATGTAHVAADDLLIPNGVVISPDGGTLIVAETGGYRLTAFDRQPDGTLTDRRIWAELTIAPDGICLDADGCVWVASPYPSSVVQRVEEGGRVLAQLSTEDPATYACALGGSDGCTLFLTQSRFPPAPGVRSGRVVTLRAPAPCAGWNQSPHDRSSLRD
jgi:sugar lactone lactonase YvrE